MVFLISNKNKESAKYESWAYLYILYKYNYEKII